MALLSRTQFAFSEPGMSSPRLLLVHHDPTLAACYAEKLATAGHLVDVVPDGETALRRLNGGLPDGIVLDLVLPTMLASEVIHTVRSISGSRDLPIITLPSALAPLLHAAQQAGATKVLRRSVDPIPELLDSVGQALGRGRLSDKVPAQLEDVWMQRLLQSATAALANCRRSVHQLAQDQTDRRALRDLLQQTHYFTEMAVLLADRAVVPLSSALEALAADLYKMPEQLNPSTVRTIGQATDFLATLLEDQHRGETKNLDAARILVVDDEPLAGQLIQSAMQLVGLRAVLADSPASSVEKLGSDAFDLIFLDVGLPEMSGFDLCTRIRSLPLHEKTPIVFLTGMATFQNRVQSSLSGGNDFIGKPFNVQELGVKALIWVFKGHLGKT